jgi:adenylate cyclase
MGGMKSLMRKRLRTIRTFSVWGVMIGVVIGLIVGRFDGLPLLPSSMRGGTIGMLIGAGVGAGEEFVLPDWSRALSFAWLNFLRISSYTLLMIVALVLVNTADGMIRFELGPIEGAAHYAVGGGLGRDLLFAFIASAAVTALLQVRKLHNPGEIRRLLTGRYHYPQEEQRVFLFADLVDSTGIAERLGHIAYSSFLRDCFSDVSEAILAWNGQVYQHAGDCVIVTWMFDRGVRSAECVECFYDMVGLLEARASDYRDRYATVPSLRAGIHGGEVVTTWVGEARKDLAFHGDTLNTTARIEGLCKDLNVQCLVSELVYRSIDLPPHLAAESVGETEVRGLSAALQLYAVSRV